MSLSLFWTILVWLMLSLGILAVSVIWVVILAATWTTVSRFLSEYKKAAADLEKEEAEAARARALEDPDYYRS